MSSILDVLGNSLKEGDLLFWVKTGLTCRIREIHTGGISLMGSKQLSPGRIVVEITFPFEPKPGQNIAFGDLMKVFDPNEEKRAEAVVERVAGIIGGRHER
jgi:hypothetical protein